MSDESIPTPAPVIDPVAEARKIMAGQTVGSDEIAGLKKQVKALWVVTAVTLLLVIVLGVFSLLPRVFGGGRPDFPGGGNFRPGMMQQGQGQGPGTAQPGQP
ncbi:MAG: hypothetical protein Q7W16_00295 [Coriobacteriia bacterium]|nr:hypothetical protein [Coriobacteriia bacterium]